MKQLFLLSVALLLMVSCRSTSTATKTQVKTETKQVNDLALVDTSKVSTTQIISLEHILSDSLELKIEHVTAYDSGGTRPLLTYHTLHLSRRTKESTNTQDSLRQTINNQITLRDKSQTQIKSDSTLNTTKKSSPSIVGAIYLYGFVLLIVLIGIIILKLRK